MFAKIGWILSCSLSRKHCQLEGDDVLISASWRHLKPRLRFSILGRGSKQHYHLWQLDHITHIDHIRKQTTLIPGFTVGTTDGKLCQVSAHRNHGMLRHPPNANPSCVAASLSRCILSPLVMVIAGGTDESFRTHRGGPIFAVWYMFVLVVY